MPIFHRYMLRRVIGHDKIEGVVRPHPSRTPPPEPRQSLESRDSAGEPPRGSGCLLRWRWHASVKPSADRRLRSRLPSPANSGRIERSSTSFLRSPGVDAARQQCAAEPHHVVRISLRAGDDRSHDVGRDVHRPAAKPRCGVGGPRAVLLPQEGHLVLAIRKGVAGHDGARVEGILESSGGVVRGHVDLSATRACASRRNRTTGQPASQSSARILDHHLAAGGRPATRSARPPSPGAAPHRWATSRRCR